tara:strand:- start:8669 stop:8995 length:327 start_codon:yes stop_codon:yes gene_type:complete
MADEKKADKKVVADKKAKSDKAAADKKVAAAKAADKAAKEEEKKNKLPYSEIVTRTYRQTWRVADLFNMIQAAYPDDKVTMDKFNPFQVSFMVGEDRLPEEGHFSVKP